MAFLTIVEDDRTFEHVPTDPETGERTQSVFFLRIVPDDEIKQMRRAHTTTVYEKHQPVEKFDDVGFASDLIDYAITGWRGVKGLRSDDDLPCTRDMKLRLPSTLKGDVIRMCAANEAGPALAKAAEEKKRSTSSSTGNGSPAITRPAASEPVLMN